MTDAQIDLGHREGAVSDGSLRGGDSTLVLGSGDSASRTNEIASLAGLPQSSFERMGLARVGFDHEPLHTEWHAKGPAAFMFREFTSGGPWRIDVGS